MRRDVRTCVLIMACLVLTACSGMGEAWRHRVGGEPALITFGCDGFAASEQSRVGNSAVHVFLVVNQNIDGQDENEAGELPTDWPDQKLPITFVNPLPVEVIASDVRKLLTSLGYAVEGEQTETARRVEVTVSRMDSGHDDAGWTELKGATWAQIGLDVTIVHGPDARWLWELTQRGEKRVMAFLASNVQSAYALAYCQILNDLNVVFQSTEFAELVR